MFRSFLSREFSKSFQKKEEGATLADNNTCKSMRQQAGTAGSSGDPKKVANKNESSESEENEKTLSYYSALREMRKQEDEVPLTILEEARSAPKEFALRNWHSREKLYAAGEVMAERAISKELLALNASKKKDCPPNSLEHPKTCLILFPKIQQVEYLATRV